MKKRTIFDKNEYVDKGYYYEIVLYNQKCEEVARTRIDKDDYEKCKKHKWYLSEYVHTNKYNKKLFLHQLILGKKKSFIIDHKNNNPLDNRKKNLRHVTSIQNCMNRKCKGYYWDKSRNNFYVQIRVNNKRISLGRYKTEEEAIKIRQEATKKYFGKFAYKS